MLGGLEATRSGSSVEMGSTEKDATKAVTPSKVMWPVMALSVFHAL
jgi:hypothetical protein